MYCCGDLHFYFHRKFKIIPIFKDNFHLLTILVTSSGTTGFLIFQKFMKIISCISITPAQNFSNLIQEPSFLKGIPNVRMDLMQLLTFVHSSLALVLHSATLYTEILEMRRFSNLQPPVRQVNLSWCFSTSCHGDRSIYVYVYSAS